MYIRILDPDHGHFCNGLGFRPWSWRNNGFNHLKKVPSLYFATFFVQEPRLLVWLPKHLVALSLQDKVKILLYLNVKENVYVGKYFYVDVVDIKILVYIRQNSDRPRVWRGRRTENMCRCWQKDPTWLFSPSVCFASNTGGRSVFWGKERAVCTVYE